MPAVAKWLGHCRCSIGVFREAHGHLPDKEAARVLAMENVAAQLAHLRTHPCVASRVAAGALTLHGWVFDIETGTLLALDGETGAFSPIGADKVVPRTSRGARRAEACGGGVINTVVCRSGRRSRTRNPVRVARTLTSCSSPPHIPK